MAKPEEVLARLAADLVETLGDQLLSVAVHGSWALGDFTPGHSDLDVLAVMATDTTPGPVPAPSPRAAQAARSGLDQPTSWEALIQTN
jgi:predicted nucleotidyltransferase